MQTSSTPQSRAKTDDRNKSGKEAEYSDTESCPECSGQLQKQNSEIVCPNCGLVIEADIIDHGPEWRSFNDSKTNRSRVGLGRTVQRHDRGLGAEIGWGDANLSIRKRRQLGRMKREERRSLTKRERNCRRLITEVKRLCGRISAGEDIINRACKIVQDAHSSDCAVGRSLNTLAAAAVVAAIRDTGLPIPMGEVCQYSNAEQREVYQMLTSVYQCVDNITPKIVNPVEHTPRVCSALELGDKAEEIERLTADLCLEAQNEELHVGVKPASIACAAVYTASIYVGGDITQKDIEEAVNVSRPTVRKHYHRMVESGILEEVR